MIAFSKEVQGVAPLSRVGIDLNEKSAVLSDGAGYDLSEVARLHTEYGVRRKGFYSNHPQDKRLKKKFAGSSRERERVRQALHETAKKIVESAKSKGQSIVLERLKGIRYAHQRGTEKAEAGGEGSPNGPSESSSHSSSTKRHGQEPGWSSSAPPGHRRRVISAIMSIEN